VFEPGPANRTSKQVQRPPSPSLALSVMGLANRCCLIIAIIRPCSGLVLDTIYEQSECFSQQTGFLRVVSHLGLPERGAFTEHAFCKPPGGAGWGGANARRSGDHSPAKNRGVQHVVSLSGEPQESRYGRVFHEHENILCTLFSLAAKEKSSAPTKNLLFDLFISVPKE